MIDPTGVVDGINAGIYFLEGDKVNAAIAAACVLIPAFFDAGVKVAKWGSKSFKSLKIAEKIVAGSTKVYDVGKYTVKRVAKGYDYARETWKASGVGSMIGKYGDDVVAGMGNASKGTARTGIMKMNLQLFAEKGADDIVLKIGKTKPNQIHHFLTNKSKTYTKGYEKIIHKYNLNLDGTWNKALLPHKGRHPNMYHDYMYDNLQQIDELANGDKEMFLELFEQIKQEIINNPDMLYKKYWRK